MNRSHLYLIIALLFAETVMLHGQEQAANLPIEDAFKENWVPPGPAYTPRPERPKQNAKMARPSFEQKISDDTQRT